MAKSTVTSLVGKSVTLKNGSKVRVTEPPAKAVMRVLEDCPEILSQLASISGDVTDATTAIFRILMSEKTADILMSLVASSVNESVEVVSEYRSSDILKILVAIKEVMDWEDLKETFFQLVPPQTLSRMRGDSREEPATSTTP